MRQDKNHLSKIDRFRSTQKEDFNNEKFVYIPTPWCCKELSLENDDWWSSTDFGR